MGVYRITSVRRSMAHGEITDVRCRKDTGERLKKARKLAVRKVRSMIGNGHEFYTFGLKSVSTARAMPFEAVHNFAFVRTIRSDVDASGDNALDDLPNF
jgi:hypothetical protein